MRGVILAGGYGTRIRPCTYYLNKHMWPVYNRPLIEYANEKLIWSGIMDIAFVMGGSHPEQVESYLGDGGRYGASFTFLWQGAPRGIADAVSRAKDFCGNEKFIVHLADNIIEDDLEEAVNDFRDGSGDCLVVLKEVADPHRFGVAELKDGQLISLEEKPKEPKSHLALVGLYGFNAHFFELYKGLKPSWRGEYELTDIIFSYVKESREILVKILEGNWFSCDTFEALLAASNYIYKKDVKRKRRD